LKWNEGLFDFFFDGAKDFAKDYKMLKEIKEHNEKCFNEKFSKI